MKLISITPYQGPDTVAGRFSDGSDRVVTPGATRYTVVVLDNLGAVQSLDFANSPSADEIAKLLPLPPTDLTPTASKAALLPIMKERVFEAQAFDWFNTKAQVDGALTVPQKTAVGALNTSLYVRARAAVAAWYKAT